MQLEPKVIWSVQTDSLLHSALNHRNFPTVRDLQQDVHAHLYERMPLIPLWQLPQTFAVHPSLSAPGLDPQQVFANVLEWKVLGQ